MLNKNLHPNYTVLDSLVFGHIVFACTKIGMLKIDQFPFEAVAL